jgi:predicted acyltransferase
MKPPFTMKTPTPSAPAPRFVSLDALRGFDMFWILCAYGLVQALAGMNQSALVKFLVEQLDHKAWSGFSFFDLIFPLFVFIVGVSLVFSLSQRMAREGRGATVKHIFRRAVLLFLLGIIYNGGLQQPWPAVRLLGVLQRIAIAYLAAGLLFCYFKPRTLASIAATILIGYWALLALVPIRNFQLSDAAVAARLGVENPTLEQARALFEATTSHVTGGFEPGLNLPNHLDFQFLPGMQYDRYYDPEGLLSSFPAIVTCLLGVFAGLLLRRADLGQRQKLQWLVIGGIGALIAGWLWHLQFPVIKKLWTSSYVLVAGGWSFLLLAAFYYLVDIRQWRSWCEPFIWIGMNPITLYLWSSFLSFDAIASRLVGGSVSLWFDAHLVRGTGQLVVALVSLAIVFAIARFLFQRKIFLRV